MLIDMLYCSVCFWVLQQCFFGLFFMTCSHSEGVHDEMRDVVTDRSWRMVDSLYIWARCILPLLEPRLHQVWFFTTNISAATEQPTLWRWPETQNDVTFNNLKPIIHILGATLLEAQNALRSSKCVATRGILSLVLRFNFVGEYGYRTVRTQVWFS